VIAPVGPAARFLGLWCPGYGTRLWPMVFAAAALLAVSGVTRLIEFWITSGTGGVA